MCALTSRVEAAREDRGQEDQEDQEAQLPTLLTASPVGGTATILPKGQQNPNGSE